MKGGESVKFYILVWDDGFQEHGFEHHRTIEEAEASKEKFPKYIQDIVYIEEVVL